MEKVRALRQRAKECLAAAEQAPTAEVRGHYEELARIWKKLADERLTFFVQDTGAQKSGTQQAGERQ